MHVPVAHKSEQCLEICIADAADRRDVQHMVDDNPPLAGAYRRLCPYCSGYFPSWPNPVAGKVSAGAASGAAARKGPYLAADASRAFWVTGARKPGARLRAPGASRGTSHQKTDAAPRSKPVYLLPVTTPTDLSWYPPHNKSSVAERFAESWMFDADMEAKRSRDEC